MGEIEELMLTEQQKGKQTGGRRITEEVNGQSEADDRSDSEEGGNSSAKLNHSLQIIGNMQHGLPQLRRDRREERTVEIPISPQYLRGPDLFFRVIKRWKSVSVSKPEKADQEYHDQQGRDPPIDPRAPSGKRLKMPLAHKTRSGGRWDVDPTRTLRVPGIQRSTYKKGI